MFTTTRDTTEATSISGVMIPDSNLARKATELVRDTESALLFNHSTRVYYFGSLAGKRQGLKFDPELLLCRRDVPRHGIDSAIQQ
jgi:hypothetical protein